MTPVPSHSPMDTVDTTYEEYDYGATDTPRPKYLAQLHEDQVFSVTLLVINVLVVLLGLCGNGVVIWIAGFKMKRTVNTTWYLSLAFSDFIYCVLLPFSITPMVTNDWIFGLFMCKFTSFVLFLNMFSSIFLMVVISVDRCVAVIFPIWTYSHQTLKKPSVAVVVAWLVSTALSVPSLVFRDVKVDPGKTRCYNNFTRDVGTSIYVARFVLGFALPLIIITACYSAIVLRLRTNRTTRSSTKPLKVMTLLIAAFVISWLPYHIFILREDHILHIVKNGIRIGEKEIKILERGLKMSFTLASANSCMNPFFYAFMGKDFKQKLCTSFISRIENAFLDEGHNTASKMPAVLLATRNTSC